MHAILIPQFYVRVLRGPLGMVSSGHHMVMLGQDLRANSVEPYTLTSVDYGQLARHGKDCTLTNDQTHFTRSCMLTYLGRSICVAQQSTFY